MKRTIKKITGLLLISLITLFFLVESTTSGICFCEKCRSMGPLDITGLSSGLTFDAFCSENNHNLCRLKNSVLYKAVQIHKQTTIANTFNASINSYTHDLSSSGLSVRHSFNGSFRPFQDLPVYLQTLSFLC